MAALKLSSLGEGLNFLSGVTSKSRTFVTWKIWHNENPFLHKLDIPILFPFIAVLMSIGDITNMLFVDLASLKF